MSGPTENTSSESVPDFVEGGAYFQILTVGVYFGYNDNKTGILFRILQQCSGGVGA